MMCIAKKKKSMSDKVFRTCCKDLIDKGYMAIYMDDILVYTHMIEHHQKVVTGVLDVLRKY